MTILQALVFPYHFVINYFWSLKILLSELISPITVVNLSEYDIDLINVQKDIAQSYKDYAWDNYLLQQDKIKVIQADISAEQFKKPPSHIWIDLYQDKIKDSEISTVFPQISVGCLELIQSQRATRQRCVSEFTLERNGRQWHINRIASQPFVQTEALIASNDALDYRLTPRTFKELPDHLFDDNLKGKLRAVAEQTCEHRPSTQRLSIVVHHTVVWCDAKQAGSNSPEGIHQDGMDFIVSALCIERRNVQGGRSIVYGADKATPIFAMELQPGQGIFQPDARTSLWHEVTPISVKNLPCPVIAPLSALMSWFWHEFKKIPAFYIIASQLRYCQMR
ncbi:MAG: 2OG-Fe dioxygenase family protein [Glaciimonas sp.]|nr:2OG-Fe dioxygenase family protein [Glaciimonas sp.]